MRLDDKPLSFVVNFLLGVTWASVIVGAVTSFLTFFNDSLIFALVSAFVGMIPGLVAVLLIEHFITNKEKLHELKKQTKILEQKHKDTSNNPRDT